MFVYLFLFCFFFFCLMLFLFFFFFQAEDGIRDIGVTGVQTCALPISFTLLEPSLPSQGIASVRYKFPLNLSTLGKSGVFERLN